MSSKDFWSASAARNDEPEIDVDKVFANFKNNRTRSQMTDAQARDRGRRRGEDRMRGVVVEVRRSKASKPEESEATSAFRI